MSDDTLLYRIQTLQFQDKPTAERLLEIFIRETFSLPVRSVELRPLAVSLNSFNGFMTLTDGKRLFFKSHAEPDNVISEYYNAQRLAEAGYPIIQPVFSSTDAGKQLLIYEVVKASSVFDIAWNIENGDDSYLQVLTNAQNSADDLLFDLYKETLAFQDSNDAALSPVHQLFYHRLTGGRLARFYGGLHGREGEHKITLPVGDCNMYQVRQAQWQINGQHYNQTLDATIASAICLLNPVQAGMSIIGHGDAHNGNVFFDTNATPPALVYFDPAFAGCHDPLLDLAKPLFHNIFAMWMYFPNEKTKTIQINQKVDGNLWVIEHDYQLHPVRLMFLKSKVERVLVPLLQVLKANKQLRSDWRAYLKSALFCCPLLTMNLADSIKFTPEISLLGLAMSIEMGCESIHRRSYIDTILDEVTRSLL